MRHRNFGTDRTERTDLGSVVQVPPAVEYELQIPNGKLDADESASYYEVESIKWLIPRPMKEESRRFVQSHSETQPPDTFDLSYAVTSVSSA